MASRRVRAVVLALAVVGTAGSGRAIAQTVPAEAGTSCRPAAANLTAGSLAIGRPSRGRLMRGVRFPASATFAFTWDFPLATTPNRPWRRWGTELLVRTLECVLTADELAHPFGQRVGVADLSRPHGGPFGPQFGGQGHASHQNGLDADVLYPTLSDCECAATTVADVDVARSQELIDAFVDAGAQYVFVSPVLWRRGLLHGPRAIVRPLVYHDDHLHVRLRP